MKKIAVMLLGFLLAIGTPVLACDATIKSISAPDKGMAGEEVQITVKYDVMAKETPDTDCDFLLEAGVRPTDWTYSLVSLVQADTPICCHGNENYADFKFSSNLNKEEETVEYSLKLPEPGMKDSCPPPGEEGMDYWDGDGTYKIVVGAYNGCSDEVENFKTHAWDTRTITVKQEIDSDGDGVMDDEDDCSHQYGERENGCPRIDPDNDGVYGEDDACPNTYGEDPYGCPIEVECSASIQNVDVPKNAKAGKAVTAEVKYKLTAENGECDFLLESGIRPTSWAYRIFSVIRTGKPICCPGNDNYADIRQTVRSDTERVTVRHKMKAPEPGMRDSCPPPGESPQKYWTGEGSYEVIVGAYNGCSGEVSQLQTYDNQFETIHLSSVEKDSDGDGVPNSGDECKYTYGTKPNGCPKEEDSDGDGIVDEHDRCKYEASDDCGPDETFDGECCVSGQDSDNDGVPDSEDTCKHESSQDCTADEEFNGECCVSEGDNDWDDDSIPNDPDDCPREGLGDCSAGQTFNYQTGCCHGGVNDDWDGDGIINNKDDCPYESGPPENDGCPEKIPWKWIAILAGIAVGGAVAYKKL